VWECGEQQGHIQEVKKLAASCIWQGSHAVGCKGHEETRQRKLHSGYIVVNIELDVENNEREGPGRCQTTSGSIKACCCLVWNICWSDVGAIIAECCHLGSIS
jgi:hypothetical protein